MGKTTAKHFAYFEKRVKYWQDRFGLGDWQIEVDHDDLRGEEGEIVKGGTFTHDNGQHTTIMLGKEWDVYKISQKSLNSTARHEVLEVVLNDLRKAAAQSMAWDRVDKLVHAVIHRIEKAIDG